MLFNPDIETLPLPRLRILQVQRLKNLIEYVKRNVPFYAEKLVNLSSKDIKGVRDIEKLPFTYKEDLRNNYPFGLFAVPKSSLARIHASSGTTGKPTVVGYTQRDLRLFGEVNARSLAAAGARPGMTLHNAYGYGLFTGGLGLHAGAEALGLNVIPVSGGMTERQLLIIEDFQPELICCTPSYAQRLADEIRIKAIDPSKLSLKFALLGAEPWSEAIRQDAELGLHIEATNIYGLSEIIGPGVAQEPVEEKGAGSHIWEDHFYPEIIDPETGTVLPEGKDGVLVLTTLTKEAIPLIRYWTNDICSLQYDPDSRRTHIKMSNIKGRADNMLIIRGVNLFPSQIEALLLQTSELSAHYQLEVSRPATMDELLVKVESVEELSTDGRAYLAGYLQQKIKDNIGISARVMVEKYGTLPRSEGGKLSRIIDKRDSY